MNQRIKNLNYDKLLFVDIKTVRGEKDFDETHPLYDTWAWKQRDRDTNIIPVFSEVLDAYYNKAALYAEWGKIVCISVGYIKKEGGLKTISYTGDEKTILQDFVSMVKKSKRMLVGWNLIKFDVPYIRKRFFINGLTEYLGEKQGNDVYAKPWDLDDSIFDLMVAWKGSGYTSTSMEEVAMAFGITSSKEVMHGNEVSEYYYSDKIDEIATYCKEDVRVVTEILRAWKKDVVITKKDDEEGEYAGF